MAWLGEIPKDSITSWEELTKAFLERFFHPSKMLQLQDDITNYRRIDGKPLYETWIYFQKKQIQFPTHGLPDKVLLQVFYRSLDQMNKAAADQLVGGGIMCQPFSIASTLLDRMEKANRAWHTREDEVAPASLSISKEQLLKDHERYENIAKIMTQMDIWTNHVMGGGSKSVNVMGVSGDKSIDVEKFEARYNEELQFLSNP